LIGAQVQTELNRKSRKSWNAFDQLVRVFVLRMREHGFGGAMFEYFASVHHDDVVTDMADDGKIVGNEQVGEVQSLPEFLQESDDLSLHGNVER
jgi:hypothetical protein